MKAEEWQKGMENEAASVEDEGWARETRRATRHLTQRPLLWDAFLSAMLVLLSGYVFLTLLASLLQYSLRLDFNPVGAWLSDFVGAATLVTSLDVILMFLPLLWGFVLGTLRVRPGIVAAMFLLTPLLFALAALLYQMMHSPITYLTQEGPVTVNLMGYAVNRVSIGLAGISAVTALMGAWAGNRLVSRAPRRGA